MTRQYFPALRGIFGEWVYYSCLMTLRDVGKRVQFADKIHKSKALSDLIQRKLKQGRADEIASYLEANPERFFNTLVIAVYDGDPAWHELDQIKSQSKDFDVEDVPEDAIASLGFLSFTGGEKLFALDGQHRLAGIQQAVGENDEIGDDDASVIFVSHKNDAAGMRRTRALFTTLNKTAKPVNKSETIALDESDVMAIITRRLIESDKRFTDKRILVGDTPNLPAGDDAHLTTIQNLYDVLTIIFSKVVDKKSVKLLSFNRPPDEELDRYYKHAIDYFEKLANSVPELKAFFAASDPARIVRKHRRDNGGSVLFRPVGQTMFALIAEALVKSYTLDKAIGLMGKLPRELSKPPYANLLWDVSSGTMNLKRQALVRRILLYMLGVKGGGLSAAALKADIANATGIAQARVTLPAKVV